VHHLPAPEVVCGRLYLWRWGGWQSGSGEAASAQGCKRATVLEHFSACGHIAGSLWCVEPGARLFAVLRLLTGLLSCAPVPRVAVRGVGGMRSLSLMRDMAWELSHITGFSEASRWMQ
jgi:hypothetical protein